MDYIEVADVFRQFGPSYIEAFGERMLPSHRRAIEDITACRTKAMGGHLYQCEDCGERFHVYHGCRNRSCPACHTRQTALWLEARTAELLPCPYYHVCVTVPAELRAMFRANQKDAYGMLMKAAAETVMALCRDTRYMGAAPAILAVLHTWTVRMDHHPHVHLLVSGGGIADGGAAWREAKHPFLIPVRAASLILRAKFRALMDKRQPGLCAQQPRAAWSKKWNVWCKYSGEGQTAVLDYLARYVHRIAITNARIVAMDEGTVTFRYKETKKSRWRTCTLTGHEFMRRFLQHVLPKGFHKVRYYGLANPKKRALLDNARIALQLAPHRAERPASKPVGMDAPQPLTPEDSIEATDAHDAAPICPHCQSLNTSHIGPVQPPRPMTHNRASPQRDSDAKIER
jgi:hypothetical protein